MLLDLQSSLDNCRYHECLLLYKHQILRSCQVRWWYLSSWAQWKLWVYRYLTMTSCTEREVWYWIQFIQRAYFLVEYENPAMEIFKLFSVFEGQGGWIRLNITIHPSNVRSIWMDKSGYNSISWDLMIISADNILSLRYHGGFYKSVISHFH